MHQAIAFPKKWDEISKTNNKYRDIFEMGVLTIALITVRLETSAN